MPRKPLKICAFSNCQTPTYGKYCDAHKGQDAEAWKAVKRIPGASRMYGQAWREYRLRFLRQHPICSCGREASEVDHIVAHRGDYALFWDASNHQGLCEQCHLAKTAREMNERKK